MTGLRMYSDYKTSGTQWLGDIPAHWGVTRLGRGFELMRRAPRESDTNLTAYRDGQVTLRSNRRLDGYTEADKEIGYQGIRVGDLVIHAMDAFAGAIGVSDSDGKSSPVYLACRALPGHEAAYFARVMRHIALSGYITSLGKGVRERSTDFRWSDAKNVLVPVPPVHEQRGILKYLDQETGRIDALIAKQEQLVETLTERRQAVITHAVTRGLDPGVDFKDSGIAAIGRIPGHWQVKKLSYLFSTIGSGTTPAAEGTDFYDGDMPWVTTGELRESVILTTRKAVSESALRTLSALKVFPAGSLVLAMYGATIGRLGILGVDATTNQACCVLAEPSGVNVEFAYFSLQVATERLLNMASGGGQPNINQDVVRQFRIAVPSLAEQSEIVRHLTIEASRIDNLVVKARQVVEVLKERRQALISAAVTGKIDVRGL
jgi:type I restriction enzyme S subunit